MNVVLCHRNNLDVMNKLVAKNYKLIVIGDRDKNFYHINKNVSFLNIEQFIKKYKKQNFSLLILDEIDYIHPNSLITFKKSNPKYKYLGCNFYGNQEIYLSQVMGLIPEVMFDEWHDNYLEKNLLSKSDLPEDLIEVFISKYKSNPEKFDFNKFFISKYRSVYYSSKNPLKHLKSKNIKTIKDLIFILCLNKCYLKSDCWYSSINTLSEIVKSRLYKYC